MINPPEITPPPCMLCQGRNFRIFQETTSQSKALECQDCHLVFIHPPPEAKFLKAHYNDEEYYREWIEKQMPRRIVMWGQRLKDLQRHRSHGRLLDIGCGLGTFLHLAKKEGFQVEGTEISRFACQFSEEQYGIKPFQGYLQDARFPSGHFDIVSLWHVLEHLHNPQEVLKEIHRILKPGGLFVVAVPHLNNYIMQWAYRIAKGKKLVLFSVEDKELHLYHYSEITLKRLIESHGFEVIQQSIDWGQVVWTHQLLDLLACFVYFVTGKNYSQAIRVYAVKR
ncbi:MAG: class I SAM-dependent methyltransferase [Candidatus Omnitrophica bacterium]|nr:class I SAM-dependent methyltransferase [Candidatus Omnitrophota bacterium]